MNEKTSLEFLTKNSVSLQKQSVTEINGKEDLIGEPWNKQYCNSVKGRIEVNKEVAEPFKTAILAVWGDTATIEDVTQ